MNKEFKWNDESVMEFYNFHRERENQWTSESIQQFKESKQPKPEWEIIQVSSPECGIYYLEGYKMRPNDKIYSVKRLSDGKVFTIGDKYKNLSQTQIYTIKEFEIRDGVLRANAAEYGFDFFEDLIKVKEILFITEDGRPVYKDDKFYYVNKYFIIDEYWADNAWTPKEDGLEFSTEEKAQEYVLMNKPLFSVQEIHDFLSIELGNYNILREKAKEKLNKP